MKRLQLAAVVFFLLLQAAASAQVSPPQLIDQVAANRHGLTRAWFAYLEASGGQSHIVDIKFDGGTLFVQTRAATTHAIDGVTGRTLWVADVGSAQQPSQPLGIGEKRVVVVNGTTAYVLDRATGQVEFSLRSRGMPSAGAAITDEAIFLPNMAGQVETFSLIFDDHRNVANLRVTGRDLTQPVISSIGIAWGSDGGELAVADHAGKRLVFRNSTRFAFVSRPAARGREIYAGNSGGLLYNFRDLSGKERWTFAAGSAINQPPMPFADAVYVLCENMTMMRVSVETGREEWMAKNIRSFLATTPTKVYCIDRLGRMVTLAANTGALLDRVAIPPFAFPVANAHSDQIFLATDTGLIQSLHEIELAQRLDYRAPKEEAPKKAPRSPAAGKDVKSKAGKEPAADDAPPPEEPKAVPAPPAANDPFAPQPMPKQAEAADPFGGL